MSRSVRQGLYGVVSLVRNREVNPKGIQADGKNRPLSIVHRHWDDDFVLVRGLFTGLIGRGLMRFHRINFGIHTIQGPAIYQVPLSLQAVPAV